MKSICKAVMAGVKETDKTPFIRIVCIGPFWPFPGVNNTLAPLAAGPLSLSFGSQGGPKIGWLKLKTRWWFQIFFIFIPIWGRFPI